MYESEFDGSQTTLLFSGAVDHPYFPASAGSTSSIDEATQAYLPEPDLMFQGELFSSSNVYAWLCTGDEDISFIPDSSEATLEHLASSLERHEVSSGNCDSPVISTCPDEHAVKMSRRKQQNRAAQRAFRERKDRNVRELEQTAKSAKERAAELESENRRLADQLKEAQIQINTLRSLSSQREAMNITDITPDSKCSEITRDDSGTLLLRIHLGKLALEGSQAFHV